MEVSSTWTRVYDAMAGYVIVDRHGECRLALMLHRVDVTATKTQRLVKGRGSFSTTGYKPLHRKSCAMLEPDAPDTATWDGHADRIPAHPTILSTSSPNHSLEQSTLGERHGYYTHRHAQLVDLCQGDKHVHEAVQVRSSSSGRFLLLT